MVNTVIEPSSEFLGYLEAYLKEVNQNAEFIEYLETVEDKCNTLFDGSQHFKWICILVLFLLIYNRRI